MLLAMLFAICLETAIYPHIFANTLEDENNSTLLNITVIEFNGTEINEEYTEIITNGSVILTNYSRIIANESEATTNESQIITTEIPDLTLTQIEARISKYLNRWMWSVIPQARKSIDKFNLTRSCLYSFGYYAYNAAKIQAWAFKMLDATGKLTDGIFEGTATSLGDYDECQNSVVGGQQPVWNENTGLYCLLEIRPPKGVTDAMREYQYGENRSFTALGMTQTFFSFLRNVKKDPEDVMFLLGICIPPKCTAEDIQSVLNTATQDIRLPIKVRRCEAKRFPRLQLHHTIILGILGTAATFVLVGTMIDAFLRLFPEGKTEKIKLWWIFSFFMQFSLFFNTSKLVESELDGNALDPVRGLKVMSAVLLIFVHTYALPHPLHVLRFRSAFNFLRFTDDFSFASIANSSVGVDTIFFIVGFLSVYYYWKQGEKTGVLKYILKFFCIQYLRLILAQVLIICLFSLLPLIGSGPLWPEFIDKKLETCKKMWWINLLCIQNFWEPENSCLFHTWILAVCMQIFIFTAFVLWVLSRKPQVAMAMNIVLILSSIVAVTVLTLLKKFPPTFSLYFSDNYRQLMDVWMYIYVQGYTHLGSYCIGMMVAYWTAKYPSAKFIKPGILLCWFVAVITCLSIIFGLYEYRDTKPMERTLAVFYAAAHRTAWTSAIGWMIYACATGYGGFVNSILSSKLFVPLERLTYMAYIVHVPLMYYHGGIQRERIYMGHFTQIMNFLGYAAISFIISFFIFVLFQGPYNALECFVLETKSRSVWETEKEKVSNHEPSEGDNDDAASHHTPVVLFNKSTENILAQT